MTNCIITLYPQLLTASFHCFPKYQLRHSVVSPIANCVIPLFPPITNQKIGVCVSRNPHVQNRRRLVSIFVEPAAGAMHISNISISEITKRNTPAPRMRRAKCKKSTLACVKKMEVGRIKWMIGSEIQDYQDLKPDSETSSRDAHLSGSCCKESPVHDTQNEMAFEFGRLPTAANKKVG